MFVVLFFRSINAMVEPQDNDEFEFLVDNRQMASILEHLTTSLSASHLLIPGSQADSVVRLEWEGVVYSLPQYATRLDLYDLSEEPVPPEGYNSVEPRFERLEEGSTIEDVETGLWVSEGNADIIFYGRVAYQHRTRHDLVHLQLSFDVGLDQTRMILNVWGGQYSHRLEEDMAFRKLFDGLLGNSIGFVHREPSFGAASRDFGDEEEAFLLAQCEEAFEHLDSRTDANGLASEEVFCREDEIDAEDQYALHMKNYHAIQPAEFE